MNFRKFWAVCSARRSSSNRATMAVCQFLFAASFILATGCEEKSNGQTTAENIKKDSLSQPKVNIQVNRRYDKDGNVLSFDSTYTSFYSNMNNDTVSMDSLMRGFDHYFDHNHPSIFQQEFSPLFFTDSLRYPDFFHHDFFMRRYELNDLYMRDMMKRMDSIKNKYFKENSEGFKEDKTL